MMRRWGSEKDLRAYVRENASGIVFVEPARGSTFGLPDCYSVPYALWIELKMGKWSAQKGQLIVKYETQQLVQFDQFEKADNPVITLIGEKGARQKDLWWCPYHDLSKTRRVKFQHLNQFFAFAASFVQEMAFEGEDD